MCQTTFVNRRRGVSMRWCLFVFVGVLGGCSSLTGVAPDIDYQVVVQAVVSECDRPPGPNIDFKTAMEVGFTKVQAACEAFFVDATRAQQAALATNQGFDAALLAANAIIPLTNSATTATKVLAITSAGILLGKTLVTDYTTIYTFNTYLSKVRAHVYSSMDDFAQKSRASPPTNYCMAYTYVQKFAMLCTLAAMKAILDSQVAANLPIAPLPPAGGGAAPPAALRSPGVVAPASLRNSGPPSINYSV